MYLHKFEPQEGKIKEFVNFCKCLVSLLKDTESKNIKKIGLSKDSNDPKKAGTAVPTERKKYCRKNRKQDKDKPFYCIICGINTMHSTNHCRTLQKDAENARKIARKMAVEISARASKNSTLLWNFPGKQWSQLKQPTQRGGVK